MSFSFFKKIKIVTLNFNFKKTFLVIFYILNKRSLKNVTKYKNTYFIIKKVFSFNK